jgi:hypothetical protein
LMPGCGPMRPRSRRWRDTAATSGGPSGPPSARCRSARCRRSCWRSSTPTCGAAEPAAAMSASRRPPDGC